MLKSEAVRTTTWQVRVPVDAIASIDNGLSDQAFRMLLMFDGMARIDTFCYPGNDYLAKKFDRKQRTIQVILKELEAQGWIKRLFFAGEKGDRAGVILLRRFSPSSPVANTPEKVEEATRQLSERIQRRSRFRKPVVLKAQKPANPRAQKIANPRAQKTAPEVCISGGPPPRNTPQARRRRPPGRPACRGFSAPTRWRGIVASIRWRGWGPRG